MSLQDAEREQFHREQVQGLETHQVALSAAAAAAAARHAEELSVAKAELQVAQTTAAAATASAEKAATDAQAHSDALGETCGDVQPFSCLLK